MDGCMDGIGGEGGLMWNTRMLLTGKGKRERERERGKSTFLDFFFLHLGFELVLEVAFVGVGKVV